MNELLRAQDKPTGLGVIKENIKNWRVEYFLIPLAPVLIVVLAKFVYYLTGRAASENANALVGFGFRLFDIAALIICLSLTKETVGHWYTKEELLNNPKIAWISGVTTIAFAVIFAYMLTH